MTATLEDRLADSLRDRADRLTSPPPCLADTVIRRGRRARRRRRVTAAACVLALVAGAAVAFESIRIDPRSMQGSYATSIEPNALAEGEASAVPYTVGRILVDDAGRFELPWPGLEIRSVWEVADGYLVEAAGPDSTSVLKVPSSGGSVEEVAAPIRGLVVSSDGMQYAWEDLGTDPPEVAVTDTYGEETTQYPVLPRDLAVVGFVPEERGLRLDLLLQPAEGGPIRVWDFGTNAVVDTGLTGSVLDARNPSITLVTIDGCVTAVGSGWTVRWSDCALVPDRGTVSPDGSRVVVLRADGSVVIRDARSGTDLGAIAVTNGAVGDVRWEDDGHIVMSITPSGDDARVARCDAESGECEWAGPPAPSPAPNDEYADLVLGRRALPE